MKFFLIIFLWFPAIALCQDKILGKVLSNKGEALHGASVFISNTTIGTTTNANGEFVLEHLPAGSINLTVSFVGYEVTTVLIAKDMRSKHYLIQLQPKSNELKAVIIGNYDKRGWKKWGTTFINAFIGTSAYAKDCSIANKDVIRFIYNDKTKQLHAYADEPLLIENAALGYHIAVTLADFSYETITGIVDYQVYSLFTEMEGTDDQELQWKTNREKVYAYSLLHFMRALYNQNLKNEGFQVRVIESMPNSEKQRVQELYKSKFITIKETLKDAVANDIIINKEIEKLFTKDSLAYYKEVLTQEDRTSNMHIELKSFKDIASRTDSNTVIFHFNDYLQVTYSKAKEPKEYVKFKNKLYIDRNIITSTDMKDVFQGYPSTTLSLTQGIPLEIAENGYFINIDLFMDGFWGWWEKMATTLPYEYEP